MHREEARQLLLCTDCGCEVSALDRTYTFGLSGVLCWDCAEKRGGRYDGRREVWDVNPRTEDLDLTGFDDA